MPHHYMCKIGLLYGGVHWQEAGLRRTGVPYERIYIYRYKGLKQLKKFDVIFIPKGINQEFLYARRKDLMDFVRGGGVLVSFGEHDSNWLPDAYWKPAAYGQQVSIELPDHPIFEGCTNDSLNAFSKAVHGYFSTVPGSAEILAVTQEHPDRKVVFIDDQSFEGTLLAMTLDPDYHSYEGKDEAIHFLTNIINWTENKAFKIRTKIPENFDQKTGYEEFTRSFFQKVFDPRMILIEALAGIILSLVAYFIFGIQL